MRTAKGSNVGNHVAYRQEGLLVEDDRGQRASVDVLPDDVLLEIFNFYLDGDRTDGWHELVHVCRRWRQVVFASPLWLNLRLLCTSRRPVKELLHIWPALPIVIMDHGANLGLRAIANIDAALKHNDRVYKITLDRVLGPLLNSMKEPFPALTSLQLWSYDNRLPVLPSSFLGRSAPRLQTLSLFGIAFPGLPKLLLSTHHLVNLCLSSIPDSGFISPGAMVTCLSSLTNLRVLWLGFQLLRPRLHQTSRHRPPLTRTVLPSLTSLRFKGGSEYLEDVVARIDMPLLNEIKIIFFNQPMFDTPVLRSFISRTEAFEAFDRAEIHFSYDYIGATLLREGEAYNGVLRLGILCKPSDWQLSCLARAYNSALPPLPTLEHLNISESRSYALHWQDIERTQWLELLRPFITVKSLYLDEELAPRVGPALQELAGERVTEVLPALQSVFVQGPVPRAIAQFIAAQQHLGHPVAVQNWDGKRLLPE